VNVIDFPVPPEADIDDAELARILSQTCGSLVLANGRLDAEKANLQGLLDDMTVYEAVAQSWALSFQRRLEAIQVRRLRWIAWGGAGGAALALILDGTVARWFA
jgi:hypothetical protein